MSNAKEKILATIQRLPDVLSYGEAIEAIRLTQEIDEGLTQVSQEKTTPHEIVKQEMQALIKDFKTNKK